MAADGNQTENSCFLGVGRSLNGRRWINKVTDERAALTLAQRTGVPEIVGRVLAARGVSLDDAASFLKPTLRDLLPDPSIFKGMNEGTERLASAIMQGERIAVFGDYDVDGATSSALLSRFIKAVGGCCQVYIPDRLKEGYGPNQAALMALKEQGVSLVITVDCGVGAHGPLTAAANAGLDVIVVDHHAAEARLPPAVAIINPNRLDETDGPNGGKVHGQLAAVGVAFLLLVSVNRALRGAGWYADRPEPDARRWLDLVALGTVCDVVPLTGVNRALVARGLEVMGQRTNPGLAALADQAGVDQAPGAYHAGFVLGPRINAGGRVGVADLGSRLLSTDDAEEARRLAERLDGLNRERQDTEAGVLHEALSQIEETDADSHPVIVAAGEGWHPGVIGIVASRLKDKFDRPACVIAMDGNGGTGSGRSVRGFDLGAAVIAARQSGHLVGGGGHPMAAGFTIARESLEDFVQFLNDRMALEVPSPPVRGLYLDGGLKVGAASLSLVNVLEQVGPFGAGNPEPRFAITDARLERAVPVGRDQSHLSCTLAGDDGTRLNAIAFRAVNSDLGQALLRHDGAPFHLAGRLRVNTWQGRTSPQLFIDDAAPVW